MVLSGQRLELPQEAHDANLANIFERCWAQEQSDRPHFSSILPMIQEQVEVLGDPREEDAELVEQERLNKIADREADLRKCSASYWCRAHER